ncbi:MAG: TRAP transporter small permease [Peptococcales bacterium]
MLNIYDSFLGKLTKTLRTLLAVIFILCLIIGVTQVLCRYILPFNFAWTNEITVYGFVWMSMIGAAIAAGEKGHIAMDFIRVKLKGRARKYLELLIYISSLTAFFILTYYGTILTLRNIIQLSPVMRISMAIPYAAVPFGSLCIIIYTLRHLLEVFEKSETKRSEVKVHG